jgi:hypothetical protein
MPYTSDENSSVQQPLSMDRCSFLVFPSEAEGSAVPRTFRGNLESYPQLELSSRPERTRISCHAALETTARAAFSKESRMKFDNATNINRKSGAA